MTLDERTKTQPRAISTAKIVSGGALVLIGLLWLAERAGWVDVTVTAVFGLATLFVGIGTMVASRSGEHAGLVALGAILALLTVFTTLAPVEGFQGGVGDRFFQVRAAADLESDYDLAMGKMTIDLTDLEPVPGSLRFDANVGIGDLVIRVPEGLAVEVEAHAGIGQVVILGESDDGVGVDRQFRSEGYATAERKISIRADVFIGQVEVIQNG
ncbi:MAG: cell wall-active antibiotics response protein [Acidimicrobiia bacterium]|nr:cell wall-active antibiotics response protein [Acidimicrobiia bacterium]MDH4307188.1 cell wall-active antibiotics response protein [Acidimicrobiia bacterium]